MNFDIESIKRKMLVKYPFFGSVLANVNYKEDRETKTAATDGKTIYYNPESLKKLKLDEQIFFITHEVCHIAFNHILRSENKDLKLWNIATDAVINQFLKRDGLKIPKGNVDIEEAINYNSEQLYDKLFKEKQQNQEYGFSDEQKYDEDYDTHSMWQDAVKRLKEESQSDELQQEIDKISKMGEQCAFNKNLEEKKENLKALKQILSEQVTKAGVYTNSEQRIIYEIGKAKPIIDWRYVLRETIQYDVDWSYKNAYIEDGVVIANLEERPMTETEILLDTSESINDQLLRNFLRECKNILKYSKLKVGCFDTEFYGFQEIRTEEDIDNIVFKGRGGTDFNVAVNSFSRRVENKIIFTDGYASMPNIPMNVIWIVFNKGKINPKGGKVIYVPYEQLNFIDHKINIKHR